MEIHITRGTQNEIISLWNIYNSMNECGQHFLVLEGGIAVGKTFLAQKLAEEIVDNKDNIRLFQFHEGYSYENFVYGLQIETEDAKLKYTKGMQPLMEIINECDGTNEKYVIIIDDMNRTNIMSTFGDLFTALESKEIGNAIKTDVRDITIPDNLFIIATMNPLVGKHPIDYAWFRRFTVVELKANKKYWEDNNISEDYKRYSDYSEEIFMHVRMLFDYYFTDQDNQKAKENYIPGHGLFLKYDDAHSPKENLVNLHDRLKYIVAPILEEYIRQGVLEEYARLDVIAMKNIWGNDLIIEEITPKGKAFGRLHNKINELIKNHDFNSNALFFFVLHSSCNLAQITNYKRSTSECIIERSEKKLALLDEIISHAKKQGERKGTGVTIQKINHMNYSWKSGTAHGSIGVKDINNNIVKAEKTDDMIKQLINNIDTIIEKRSEIKKEMMQ